MKPTAEVRTICHESALCAFLMTFKWTPNLPALKNRLLNISNGKLSNVLILEPQGK